MITLVLESSENSASTGSIESFEELSVELWGRLAREFDEILKPGEFVLIEAQVAGRQKQDRTTKLVHHWMVLKARRIQILTKTVENGGM